MLDKPHVFKVEILSGASVHSGASAVVEAPARVASNIMMRGFIGAYTYIRAGSRVAAGTGFIGRYCSIAPGVIIGDGQHATNWLSTHPFQESNSLFWLSKPSSVQPPPREKQKPPAIIGNDVWIGANAIIMRGVVVGDGSIIAAGAVVTKDVPPYAIVAGVPAKVIKWRFDHKTIKRLIALQWWRYTAESLLGVPFNDINASIAEIRSRKKAGTLCLVSGPLYRVSGGGVDMITEEAEEKKAASRFTSMCRKTSRLEENKSEATRGFGRLASFLSWLVVR